MITRQPSQSGWIMADFFIRVLKWLAALVTAYFLLFFLLFLLLVGVGVAFQPAPKVVEGDSILVLDLGFTLSDQPTSEDPAELITSALQGDLLEKASLRQVLETLEEARGDSRLSGLLIRGNLLPGSSGGSFAALRELRRSVADFAVEKPVWAYLEMDSLRDLYLKSAASEIIANPHAAADFRGLRAERLYMGEALERIGIGFQVAVFEEYKSAADTLLRGSMSEAEQQELAALLGDLWQVIAGDIAEARELDLEQLDRLAGDQVLLYGQELVEAGLADQLLEKDAFIDYMASHSGYSESGETFRQFAFLDYRDSAAPTFPTLEMMNQQNQVAIVYADGMLIDGEDGDGYIGSDRVVRDLRELRNDQSVKAIVLRINSPGGSATASNKVARAIQETNREKPVMVSMGGIATSAGYMMAASGDYIFCEPSTITGSIGVVLTLPNIKELAAKLSLNFDGVETHPFAGTYSLARPKTEEEMRQIRDLARQFYEDFLQLVAESREMDRERVREVARGRVWSGEAALANGLVDETGGLMQAVQRAADTAGIGDDFSITERPRPLTFDQQIQEWLVNATGGRILGKSESPLQAAYHQLEREFERLARLHDPLGLYAILPYSLNIH